jgi:C-terminal peptidase prc
MKSFKFSLFFLCLTELSLAFQPNFQNKLSAHPKNDVESWARSSLRRAVKKDFNFETTKATKQINPISRAIRDASAMAFVSMVLLFSPLAEPSSIAWADESAAPEESLLLQTSVKQEEASIIDEVWNLANKYFIDRTFNGQVTYFTYPLIPWRQNCLISFSFFITKDWNSVRATYVDQNKNVENDKAMQLVTEMVQSLGDKYTRMLDTNAYAAIQKFDLIGVGVTLMPNAQKEIIVGAPPVENSASAKVGLKSGDFVTSVNGLQTSGRTAFDIIDQISENPDAKIVSFSIRRQGENDLPGEGETFDVTMERQNLRQVKDPIQYKLSEQRKDGTNVGYIRISEFNSLVNSKLQDALEDLKKQGANAFVLDLRSNTGGAFQSAVEISALFFEDRVATYVVDSNDVELPFRTPKGKLSINPQFPLAVWLDGYSASASEVLAGSLHDNCRAVTMGDKSFGKGLIQAVYGLKNGAGLVLTVASYVTPNGDNIQGIGITPDIIGNMPAPVLVPVLSSKTDKVDFEDIKRRLDPAFCAVPEEHLTAKKSETSIATNP